MPINPATIRHEITKRNAKFFEALDGEDDLGVVLRAHIHIEHELKEYILTVAPKPGHIKFSDYEYGSLVALALTLGLDDKLKAPLLAIGSLRNSFAHRLEMKLSRHDANNLYSALSADIKSSVQQGYAATRKMPQWAHLPKLIKELPPKQHWATCVIDIRSAIILETLDAYGRSQGIQIAKGTT
jgi:hypothetical protein